jgi:predicted adenylyl cyclase CyaB
MKEIEILVRVNENLDEIKDKFKEFEYLGVSRVIDEYYYDPKRDNLKPNNKGEINECLRIRNSSGKYYITYKDDVFENDKWLYSNEYESLIDDIDAIREIFKHLGFKKLLEIDNTKEKYKYNDYEIVLENVKDLGIFMEVEYCTDLDVSVKDIKMDIQKFIDNMGLDVSEELNMGKPEMMIKLKNIVID